MSCDCCLSTLSGTTGSVITCILERLWNPVERQVLYLVRYRSNLKTFRKQAGELGALKSDVLNSVEKAEDKGEEIKAEVFNWHVETIQIEMDVEWLEEKIEKTKGFSHMWHLDWRSRHRLSRLAMKKTAEIVEHLPKGKFENGVSFPGRPADLRSLPTSDFVPLETMSKAIHSIINMLKDEKNKIIGHKGCKVVVTSRFEDVCNKMESDKNIQIEELSEQDRLKLFKIKAGLPDSNAFDRASEEVVRQCGKLPNAIVIIGGALRNKPVKEWNEAIKKERDSATITVEGIPEEMVLCVTLGCLQLKEEAKSCLQFSCLFPAYYHVSMEELVIHGLVDRLFPGAESLEEVWNKMDSVVAELKSSNLLLVDDKEGYYRIHDDTRKVVKFIANNLMAEAGLRKGWPEKEDLRECRKLSLMDSNVTLLPAGTTNQQNAGFSEVASLAHLTVLYIHVKNTNVLSIDFDNPWRNLKRFRICVNDDYWDIASTKSMHLKNLTNPLAYWVKLLLQKTEYLTFTRSRNLEDIGKIDVQGLTRWISFHLRACSINRVFSSGLYATVSNLEDLHVEYCYSLKEVFYLEEIEEEQCGLTRLRELILVGLPKLMSIWKGNHAIAELQNLKMMKVKDCGKLRNIFSKTLAQKLHTLEHLAILKCGSLEVIVSNDNAEVGGEAVQQMDLSTVPPLFFFPNLQNLLISKCNKMRSVLPLTIVQGLNLLEELTVDSCDQVERIITASGEVREAECKNMLPKLRILSFNDLPKLETVCNRDIVLRWPALQELHVWDCPNLKKLPLDSHSAQHIKKFRAQLAWFEDLQWKEEYAYAKARLKRLLTEE
ncbi:hypothetical protein LWI29_022273 [Acer saccharum]|uniref:Disease resistance protein At4g27190-like leucine-rich repeats domain-containing protein n=1 Tax=Acer saccharum TaxID=4024 RepID=A0AA39SX76_ACESA|nr:hypothetical protein LWI29_022273 [Acer saccharum]